MKNLLLLAHDDSGQEARLQAGLDLCRALDGHLNCLDVIGTSIAGYPDPEVAAFLVAGEVQRESSNRARLEERLAHEDVAWTMREASGSFSECLGDAAGLADLIILNPQLDDGPDMLHLATAMLLKARKPVLLVPESCRGFDPSGPAMVAWDGSLPAMSALTAAIPLLKLAKMVRILEIQGSSKGSVDEAASYLSRHGIHAEVDLVACFKDAPHEPSVVIQDMCEREKCTYCVMGAYGHSLVRETLFGGVTRRILASTRVPVLLAH
jgi:nucleotide-binding universal stress UspA family protein